MSKCTLYKYIKADNKLKSTVENQCLKMSNGTGFNDPFDMLLVDTINGIENVKRRIDSGGNGGMNSEALQNRQCRIGDDRRMPMV